MTTNTFSADTHVAGTLSAQAFTPPDGSITNAAIVANANIAATKVTHRFPLVYQINPGTEVTAPTVARCSE